MERHKRIAAFPHLKGILCFFHSPACVLRLPSGSVLCPIAEDASQRTDNCRVQPCASSDELACLFLSKGSRPIVFIVSCPVTFTLLSVTSLIISSKRKKNPLVRQRSISSLTSLAFLGSLLCGVLCSLRDGLVAMVTETSPGRGADKAVVVLGGANSSISLFFTVVLSPLGTLRADSLAPCWVFQSFYCIRCKTKEDST